MEESESEEEEIEEEESEENEQQSTPLHHYLLDSHFLTAEIMQI